MQQTVRSRSPKNVGETIENGRIIEKRVIAEPDAGSPQQGVAPRQGIYEYVIEVAPVLAKKPKSTKKAKTIDYGGTRRDASANPAIRRIDA